MPDRRVHQEEVRSYLQEHFSAREWTFSLPHGSGKETYFVQGNGLNYFVKIGAAIKPYLAMAEIGLTPPVVSVGYLESGQSILVQPLFPARKPSPKDFQNQLEGVATLLRKMHGAPTVKEVLPPAVSNLYKDLGMRALNHLCNRWTLYKGLVPDMSPFVDQSLENLAGQVDQFTGTGPEVSHNDICNANWLFAADERIYIIDFDAMSLEDPALDLGALLWWYYPPENRKRFLEIAGYPDDPDFKLRMRIRMSIHCLSIVLPREQSFDKFQPDLFCDFLGDFKSVLEGRENPQGYGA